MSDSVSVQKYYMHPKKFAWRSNVVVPQDNMIPTVESTMANDNTCLNKTVMSHFPADSNPVNDRTFETETQSMPSQPMADAPLDFSMKNSKNTEQPQLQNKLQESTEFVPNEPRIHYTENFSTPDKIVDKFNCNGKTSPLTNGQFRLSSPNQSSANGFSSACHSADRLQNSPAQKIIENRTSIRLEPCVNIKVENGERIRALPYEELNTHERRLEPHQQSKVSQSNEEEVNGINYHAEPSSSTHSSSLSRESSPQNRSSGSILEDALAGKQLDRPHINGTYAFPQNYNLQESSNKHPQAIPSTPHLITQLPRTNREANAACSREGVSLPNANTAVGFPGSISPVRLPDVNPNMSGINPLIPMTNPLLPIAGFPLPGSFNGMNPFLMPQLNSRLPQENNGEQKSGKPFRPFKAYAGELLLGMAQRIPISPAMYSVYNGTSSTNGSTDPSKSNSVPKREISKESENRQENATTNKEAEPVAGNFNDSQNEVNNYNTEIAETSNSFSRKRSRLSDDQKDDAYWERRRKNNEAAKRSRDARRMKEDMITQTACVLKQENMTLSLNLRHFQEENAKLLLQVKALLEEKQRKGVEIEVLKSEILSLICWKCGSRYSECFDKKRQLE